MRPLILLPLAAILVAAPPPPGQEPLEEYQALAKVIRHFLALVTWPPQGDRPMRLAIIGGNGFGTDLDVALGRGTVGGRRVVVKYMSASAFLADSQDYDALFIDRGEEGRLAAFLAKVQGKATLTMAYGEALTKRGVMVNFSLENNRIQFEVNQGRAKDAGLSISSHLLSIAKHVD